MGKRADQDHRTQKNRAGRDIEQSNQH
jgi:hypothetical protein